MKIKEEDRKSFLKLVNLLKQREAANKAIAKAIEESEPLILDSVTTTVAELAEKKIDDIKLIDITIDKLNAICVYKISYGPDEIPNEFVDDFALLEQNQNILALEYDELISVAVPLDKLFSDSLELSASIFENHNNGSSNVLSVPPLDRNQLQYIMHYTQHLHKLTQ